MGFQIKFEKNTYMKKVTLLIVVVSICIISCKKDEVEQNPFLTSFTSGKEFLASFQPSEQVFDGDMQPIIGRGGVTVNLSGPYISLQTNDTIVGVPTIYLTEYSTKFEMMFAGLPTESESRMLESGGAFKLRVQVDGVQVKSSSMSYFVPSEIVNSQMQLFYGSSDSASFWNRSFGQFPGSISMTETPSFGYTGVVNPIHNYLYEQGSMFINCDYFTDNGSPILNRSDLFIQIMTSEPLEQPTVTVSALFENYNAYMNGVWDQDRSAHKFRLLPIGEEFQCVVIGISENEQLMYAVKPIEVTENLVDTLVLVPTSEAELTVILENL